MNWKLFIDSYLLDSKGRTSTPRIKYLERNDVSTYNKIFSDTNFLDNIKPSIRQRLYHLYNDVYHIPGCTVCGNKVNFMDFSSGYRDFCSLSCRNIGTKEKREKTCLDRYGYKTPMENQEIKKSGCMKKYKVENYSKTKEFRNFISEKRKNEDDIQKSIRFSKQRSTFRERYGVDWYSKTEKWREEYYNSRYDILKFSYDNIFEKAKELDLEVLTSRESYIKNKYIDFRCQKGHEFFYDSNYLVNNFYKLKCGCPECNTSGKSSYEKEIVDFINKNGISNVIENSRNIIPPYEIDIFLPDYNLAIEFDGLYWHSELSGNKDKKYHKIKTNLCDEKNIQLIHIFENEWLGKREIIESVILSKLNIYQDKIYARKCTVSELDNDTKNNFLNDNHIQGNDRSHIKLGLFYGSELVSIMTFGRRKITGGLPKTEIFRFCNKRNTKVIGAAGKLFKYFINNYENDEIITYVDRRYGIGKFYEFLGFQKSHNSNPNYWYFRNGYYSLFHRVGFQKHKLHEKLKYFDNNMTEWQNMMENGYDRIWDCGNIVYKYN